MDLLTLLLYLLCPASQILQALSQSYRCFTSLTERMMPSCPRECRVHGALLRRGRLLTKRHRGDFSAAFPPPLRLKATELPLSRAEPVSCKEANIQAHYTLCHTCSLPPRTFLLSTIFLLLSFQSTPNLLPVLHKAHRRPLKSRKSPMFSHRTLCEHIYDCL